MIDITVIDTPYEVPSSAADTNWAAKQVAFEQALASGITVNRERIGELETDLGDLTVAVMPEDVEGTAGSGTGISSASTNYGRHVVHKITVTRAAINVDSLTADVTLWTLPAKTRVLRVVADVTATFTGGAVSDCDVTVGNSAGGAQYLLSFDVDTATGVYGDAQTELGTAIVGGASFAGDLTWATTTVVQCRFTAVGAFLSELTTGSATFYIEVCTYP